MVLPLIVLVILALGAFVVFGGVGFGVYALFSSMWFKIGAVIIIFLILDKYFGLVKRLRALLRVLIRR